jgi:uncharacterized protein YlxW (UPF0749 family)
MTQKDFKVKNGIIASGNITSSNNGFIFDATANTLSVGGSLVALASTVNTVQSNVTSLTTSVNGLQANINTVQSNVTSLTTSVNGLQANINSVQSNLVTSVNLVQSNVATLTTSVNGLQANINTVQSNLVTSVNLVQSNVTTLTTSVNGLQANINTVQANVTNIINGTTAFTGNITMNRDLTVSGNLVVGGATTTIQTTDTIIKDRVITLSNGAAAATFDTGLYLSRGTSGNVFVGFDESAKQFVAAYTNDGAGNTVTDFTIASYANVRFNNITADGLVDGVDVSTIPTNINSVQSNLTTLTTSVSTISSNLNTLTTSVGTVSTNVNSIAANVANIINGTTPFTGNISAPRIILNTQLQIGSNATSSVGATATNVFVFPGSTYRGVDLTLLVQDVTNSQYQLSKMMIVHNGTVVDWTEYAMISTNNSDLTGFTATIDAGANVAVVSTGGSANKKITVSAQYIIQ